MCVSVSVFFCECGRVLGTFHKHVVVEPPRGLLDHMALLDHVPLVTCPLVTVPPSDSVHFGTPFSPLGFIPIRAPLGIMLTFPPS